MIFNIKNIIEITSKPYQILKNISWWNKFLKIDKRTITYYSIIIELETENIVSLGVGTIVSFNNTINSRSILFRVLVSKQGKHIFETIDNIQDKIEIGNSFIVISSNYGE